MKSDRLGENDRVCACKLMESVLLNCKGRVDQVRLLPNIVPHHHDTTALMLTSMLCILL